MTLAQHLRAISRFAVLIVVLVLIGAGGAVGYTLTRAQAYQSSVRLAIGPQAPPGTSITSTVQTLENTSIPATLAEIGNSGTLHSTAQAAAHATGNITTEAIVANNSNVVQIKVTAPSASEAVNVANESAKLATQQFESLYTLYKLNTIDDAHSATSTRPSPILAGIFGGLAGLIVGYLIAIGSAALENDRIERAAYLQAGRRRLVVEQPRNTEPDEPASIGHGTLA